MLYRTLIVCVPECVRVFVESILFGPLSQYSYTENYSIIYDRPTTDIVGVGETKICKIFLRGVHMLCLHE